MEQRKLNYLLYIMLFFTAIYFAQEYRLSSQRAELNEKQSLIEKELLSLHSKLDELESINKRSFVNVQKIPLPLVFCGDTLDMDNHFIRERVEREFYSLLGNQGQLQLYFKRTERYLPTIENFLISAGLPEDLKYLSVHESALLPKIRSRSNAIGLWQFMYHTGRMYRLKIDRFIDERRDPEKATNAAIRFLGDLYKKFNSWPLALAAYNGGPGRIQRSMKEQNSNSLIDLSLPEETERYYFKIVATKIILSQPEKFGFKFTGNDFFPARTTVKVKFTIDEYMMTLDDIAATFEMSQIALKEFNPQLINSHLIRGSYDLKIPRENYYMYLEKIELEDSASQTLALQTEPKNGSTFPTPLLSE
jgi:membrane-bound lytic murein transglycosylase D